MPGKFEQFEFAEIANETRKAAYERKLATAIDEMTNSELLAFFVQFTSFIKGEQNKTRVKANALNDALLQELKGQGITQESLHEDAVKINDQARRFIKDLCVNNMVSENILYFKDAADRKAYEKHITQLEFTRNHFKREERLSKAVIGFQKQCKNILDTDADRTKLENAGRLDEFNNALSELANHIGEIRKTVNFEEALKADRTYEDIRKTADKIAKLVQECGINKHEFDISYIELVYCLYIFSSWSSLGAAVRTFIYIQMTTRRYIAARLHDVGESIQKHGKQAIDVMGKGAAAARAALVVAFWAIVYTPYNAYNKSKRLRNQNLLGSAFGAELSRMDERLQASKILRETKDTLMKHPTRVGTHLENLLNVVGVTAGFVSMGIYIPARVSVGVMNERYSFINQVRLGATGSLLGDKSAMRDSSGTRMFNIKYSKSDETFEQHGGRTKEQKKIDAKREIRNERLEIQTIDFNNHEPDEMNGAHAIIELDDDRKGYTVALTAHSEEALRKILQLLCNAVKNVDGNKLVVEFVKAPSDVDIKRIMQDALRATPKVAISYRHGELAEETIKIDPSASKKKSKRR